MTCGCPSVATWCADTKRRKAVMGGDERVATALPLIAVAVDRDKGSQIALKWTIDNLITRDHQTIILVHVNTKGRQDDAYKKEVIMPFRCFCTRKTISCKDVVLEDTDIAKAVVDFVQQAAIEKLVVGSPLRSGFVRFKTTDTPTYISRGAPDFCTVYIISTKGKVSSVRNAIRSAPATSALRLQIQSQSTSIKIDVVDQPRSSPVKGVQSGESASPQARQLQDERDLFRSPFTRGMYGYKPMSGSEADISFVSSGRPSIDRVFSPRISNALDDFEHSFDMPQTPYRLDSDAHGDESSSSFLQESFRPLPIDDVEAEIKRLRLELKQTMDMYSTACKEALTAKQKAMELHLWKMEEEQRMQEARLAEEVALAMAEKERAKCRVAMEAAEASKRIAELEGQKRMYAEMHALREAEERKKAVESLPSELRYRKYTIEEIEAATDYFAEHKKIGEGGYGPVYKSYLDHTAVAIKVLRPEASHGRTQFQQEIEILSSIRHPNMVLLLGACPDYGCLVYEYMDNGSLEDRLFRRGNTPPIPWQHRFRIAAEIGTGLLFLHQTKPEPLVHRDLKPTSILLDRNYVSKISEVGLARLVPPSVAENVTHYRMTSTVGTFCYIDPEYQQTGMLGTKSDIYSLGILLLQLVTGKPPMGLTHLVESSIERGEFEEVLDPTVPNWPVENALSLAQMALKCTELRRKDRPDLATVVLPELNRLRSLGEGNMQHYALENKQFSGLSRASSLVVRSGPLQSGFESSTSQSSVLSPTSSRHPDTIVHRYEEKQTL